MTPTDELHALKRADPARRGDDAADAERLHERILVSIESETTHRESPRTDIRRRLIVGVCALGFAASLVAVAAIAGRPAAPVSTVALSAGKISPSGLASWTPEPQAGPGSSSVLENCIDTLDANPNTTEPADVVSADTRGTVESVLVESGPYVAWCVGESATVPTYLLLDGPGNATQAPSSGSIELFASGGHLPPDGYGFAAGTVGQDVASITLTEDGHEVAATISNGWWSAWWPSTDDTLLLDGSITIENTDGGTTTIGAQTLQ
jgi:hypothetical protein